MVNTKYIKNKIKSITNIKQITKALEIVATIKLQQTKHQTEGYKHFMIEFLKILQVINQKYPELFSSDSNSQNIKKTLVIVIGTDRGLCGGLNNKLFKQTFLQYEPAKTDIDIFAIGKRTLEFFSRTNFSIVGTLSLKDNFISDDLKDLYSYIKNAMQNNTYKSIRLCFNYFHNPISQVPADLQLYPLHKQEFEYFAKQIGIHINDFISDDMQKKFVLLEPTIRTLAYEIREQLIQHIVYGAILQNKTGEYAARMLAMKNAKENATNMIKGLILSYNKARQALVTQEVSEIMSAKNAIEE